MDFALNTAAARRIALEKVSTLAAPAFIPRPEELSGEYPRCARPQHMTGTPGKREAHMLPKISVLIPTRERAATLGPCIKTCLEQDYPNFEVVVSDNASSPATQAVVDTFDNPRLRYFRHPERVSMRQNFEYAYGKATGDYVIIIGDDDGMAPNAIARIGHYLSVNPVDVLNWRSVVYYWPNHTRDGQGFLMCKYSRMYGGLQTFEPKSLLHQFAQGRITNYMSGAAIYHGCISRRLAEPMMRPNGQYFNDHMPDIYAAVAQLYFAKSFVRVHHPLSISGVSASSTGSSFLSEAANKKADGSDTPYQTFAREAAVDTNNATPYNTDVRSAQYYCIQSLLIANRLFGNQLAIDTDAWAKIVVDEVRKNPDLLRVTRAMKIHSELDQKIVDRLPPQSTAEHPGETAPKPIKPVRKFNRFDVPTAIAGEDTVATAFTSLDRTVGSDRAIEVSPLAALARPVEWARFVGRAKALSGGFAS